MNKFNLVSRILLLVACLFFSTSFVTEAVAESAEAFLNRYFAFLSKADSLDSLKAYYIFTPEEEKKMKSGPEPAMVEKLLLFMIKSEPVKVKVISKKSATDDKLQFELVPAIVPDEFVSQAQQPGFSMKGSVIIQRQNGEWKVYKDFWTVKSADKFGKSETSFGKNPDQEKEKNSESDGQSSISSQQDKLKESAVSIDQTSSFDSQFRKNLVENWNDASKGKVYAGFRVSQNGTISDIHVKDENNQKQSENYARQRLLAAQPFPELPASCKGRSFAWVVFDWGKNGLFLSGPYFETDYPDWLADKLGIKMTP